MINYILLFIIVIFLLFFGIVLYFDYYEIRGDDYGREIRKAIKDMKKGITTVIIDRPDGTFYVKKYKDGKKL